MENLLKRITVDDVINYNKFETAKQEIFSEHFSRFADTHFEDFHFSFFGVVDENRWLIGAIKKKDMGINEPPFYEEMFYILFFFDFSTNTSEPIMLSSKETGKLVKKLKKNYK